jgi:hypothetical protein
MPESGGKDPGIEARLRFPRSAFPWFPRSAWEPVFTDDPHRFERSHAERGIEGAERGIKGQERRNEGKRQTEMSATPNSAPAVLTEFSAWLTIGGH